MKRQELSDEFNHYLTGEKIAGAAKRLKRYGNPKSAEIVNIHERGGMEVTTTRLNFAKQQLRALMYRTPDGKIEQFFHLRGLTAKYDSTSRRPDGIPADDNQLVAFWSPLRLLPAPCPR